MTGYPERELSAATESDPPSPLFPPSAHTQNCGVFSRKQKYVPFYACVWPLTSNYCFGGTLVPESSRRKTRTTHDTPVSLPPTSAQIYLKLSSPVFVVKASKRAIRIDPERKTDKRRTQTNN